MKPGFEDTDSETEGNWSVVGAAEPAVTTRRPEDVEGQAGWDFGTDGRSSLAVPLMRSCARRFAGEGAAASGNSCSSGIKSR